MNKNTLVFALREMFDFKAGLRFDSSCSSKIFIFQLFEICAGECVSCLKVKLNFFPVRIKYNLSF